MFDTPFTAVVSGTTVAGESVTILLSHLRKIHCNIFLLSSLMSSKCSLPFKVFLLTLLIPALPVRTT
jgi:hypothetical protein